MAYTVGYISSDHSSNSGLLITSDCLEASIPKLSAANLDNVFQVVCWKDKQMFTLSNAWLLDRVFGKPQITPTSVSFLISAQHFYAWEYLKNNYFLNHKLA